MTDMNDKLHDAKDAVADKVSDAKDAVADKMDDAKAKVAEKKEEHAAKKKAKEEEKPRYLGEYPTNMGATHVINAPDVDEDEDKKDDK